MENTIANGIETVQELLKKLSGDEQDKKNIESVFNSLLGTPAESVSESEAPNEEANKESVSESDDAAEAAANENDSAIGGGFSDFMEGDELASMVVGVGIGAALVGGGVLLHKLFSK